MVLPPVTIRGVRRTYTVRRSFDEIREIPLWRNAGPRVSAAYDVAGNGKTALKLSLAKYYDQIGTGTPAGFNPNGNVNQTYTWTDLNGDLVFQPNERGNLTATSVPAGAILPPSEFVGKDFRRPYRNEWTGGIDHELLPNLELSVTWIQRKEHDPLTDIEIGIPFDSYFKVDRNDPGRDGVTGTSDDRTITVYNQSVPGLVSVQVTGNDDRVAQRYKGLEVDLDIYNVTNENTVYNVRNGTGLTPIREAGDLNNPIISIPTFLSPTNVLGAPDRPLQHHVPVRRKVDSGDPSCSSA
jgi:hypothetical protein